MGGKDFIDWPVFEVLTDKVFLELFLSCGHEVFIIRQQKTPGKTRSGQNLEAMARTEKDRGDED